MRRDKMGTDTGTGWERNKRTLFDEIVMNYDKIRWGYPDKLFADVIRYSGLDKGKKALEIGAGTGKATAPFLDKGYVVTAVEMGTNMVEFLLQKFKTYTNFDVITATFEDVLLEEVNYDLIYSASAFHWVDAEIGCPKVFRLLKKGGAFALFRNNPVPAEGEELYEEIQRVYEKYYYTYYISNQRPVRKSKEEFRKPAEIYRGFRFESLERYGFSEVTMKLYEGSRTYSADEYIALLETYSDHRSLPDDNRAALYAGVKEAILRHGGHHKVDYIFQLYMGKKL
jgi:ubiquinone/menaquinone biosynthesis C-methylase UbiE